MTQRDEPVSLEDAVKAALPLLWQLVGWLDGGNAESRSLSTHLRQRLGPMSKAVGLE
jgi:hypothetical protein